MVAVVDGGLATCAHMVGGRGCSSLEKRVQRPITLPGTCTLHSGRIFCVVFRTKNGISFLFRAISYFVDTYHILRSTMVVDKNKPKLVYHASTWIELVSEEDKEKRIFVLNQCITKYLVYYNQVLYIPGGGSMVGGHREVH